jgi:DNA-binding CsgD family transcriptional regulator
MRTVYTCDLGHIPQAYPLQSGAASNSNGLSKRPPKTSPKKITAMAREESGNSDSPGLLLFDSSLKPIYISEEAVAILSYPERPRKNGHLRSFLVRAIDSLFPRQDESLFPKIPHEFVSGKRLYKVRVFTLRPRLVNGPGPTLAVMLERNHRASIDITKAAERFRLTHRETEALELLTLGHKTKEIASQMRISPNTAKTFLRSVMFKIGARERTGILAKILQFAKGLVE